MHSGPDTWFMPDGLSIERLLAALEQAFGIEASPEYAAAVVYADSFDWRLFRRGYILHCHGRAWTLYHGDTGEVTVLQGGPELKASCPARDFPPGALREVLEPVLGVRALLPLATVRLVGRQVRLLNRDEKTVARLVFERQRLPESGQRFSLVRLFAIRGYDRELAAVLRILDEYEVNQPTSPLIGFEEGCQAAGRQPLDYTSKFNLQLDRSLTARQAMVQIYLHLLAAIERNIPGSVQDLDAEFLHDLRVAVRRTRSGLSLVNKVFPAEVVEDFKSKFGALGTVTGPTRDLDVYLQSREAYLSRLPAALQPGLTAFFDSLADRRCTEQKRLAKALQSRKFTALLHGWQRYLAANKRKRGLDADLMAVDLASRIIHRRFKRVMRDGQALEAATPDEVVHRLRIQCKKLRYAIEFFGSLYPADKIARLVKQLKGLQDILGDFNDLSVQQQMLQSALKELKSSQEQQGVEIAAALGGLMQSLFTEQQELRGHFTEAFVLFSDPENTALYRELFRSTQETA